MAFNSPTRKREKTPWTGPAKEKKAFLKEDQAKKAGGKGGFTGSNERPNSRKIREKTKKAEETETSTKLMNKKNRGLKNVGG